MAGINRNAQLGAHTIGGGHKDRIAIARRLKVKQTAKPTKPSHHTGTVRALGGRFDSLNKRVARINIDTGRSIRQSIGF